MAFSHALNTYICASDLGTYQRERTFGLPISSFSCVLWFVRWEGWNNNAAGKELWKFHYIYGKKGTIDIGLGIHFYTGPKAYMCDTGIQ